MAIGRTVEVASVGGPPVAPDPSAADAVEQPTEKIDSIPSTRSGALELGPANILDTCPQLVGCRWVRTPRRGAASLVGPAVSPDPAEQYEALARAILGG